MDDFYSISYKTFTRSEYEKLCERFGITAKPDTEIGGYGCKYGDFGMGHYHTVPANRLAGLEGELLQSRYRGMVRENPHLEEEREEKRLIEQENKRLNALRETYPESLETWIQSVGGLDRIYEQCQKIHSNNTIQLREEGRHFEWLIGHTCMRLGMDASKNHPDYKAPVGITIKGVYPLLPEWWGDWSETDEQHPINRIAHMLSNKRIEPYKGRVTYYGYGEDCGDDVRRNLQEWMGKF
jgi:hypothetical protein